MGATLLQREECADAGRLWQSCSDTADGGGVNYNPTPVTGGANRQGNLAGDQFANVGQLLGNLIDNACKHSPADQPVEIGIVASAKGVEITIRDWGSGIASDDLPHIFEPFFRSDASRSAGLPGVGLGLAIAKRIAATLGAAISIKSEVGVGSTFRVEFVKILPPSSAASNS